MEEKERSYIAFISYRHTPLDREAAERVQKKIENYVVPKEFREQVGGKKFGLCFRDEDELPASSSLTDSIYYALDHTKFLIVICTPNLPLSQWCEAEIRYFLKTHDRDHVLAVLADGDPSESFSPYMLHDFDENGNIVRDWEPLAANIAGENHTINNKAFKKEIVRIYAALIGCPFDELWQRERRARTNRLLTAAGAAVAVLAIFLGVVLNRNAKIEEQNTQILAQNDQITQQYDQIVEQNEQIQAQNTRIEEQNVRLQTQLSTALVDSGLGRLKEHDVRGALDDGVQALESDDPAIYDHRAVKLLSDALCAYDFEEIQSSIVYEQAQAITDLAVTADETLALFLDSGGTINCIDLEKFKLQWSITTADQNTVLYTENLGDRFIYKTSDGLFCNSVKTGGQIWSYEYQPYCGNMFQAISEDGTIFAVVDNFGPESYGPDNPSYMVFLNTEDGTEIGRSDLSRDKLTIDKMSSIRYDHRSFASDFSAGNALFACALPAEYTAEDGTADEVELMLTIDLSTFENTDVGILHSRLITHYGMDVNHKDQSVFMAGYSNTMGGVFTTLCTKGKEDYEFNNLLSDHDLRTPTGFGISDESYLHNDTPFLSNGKTILVFSDDDMFIFDRNENRLARCYAMNDTITNAFWTNTDKKAYDVMMSDGSIMGYDLSDDDLFDYIYVQEGFDQSDIRCVQQLNRGILRNDKDGMYLTAGGENQNRLLLARIVTDPHFTELPLRGISDYSYTSSIFFLPDSDTVLHLYNGSEAFSFDRRNGEVLKKAQFDESFTLSTDLFALDDEHFLSGEKQFKMDGTIEKFGEPFFEENADPVYPNKHARLDDGSVLSWNKYSSLDVALQYSSAEYGSVFGPLPNLCLVWKDGVPVETSSDPEHTLMLHDEGFVDESKLTGSGCGTLFAYGRRITTKNKFLITDEEAKFHFFDPFTENITTIENHYPNSGDFTITMANKNPWAAVLYEDGNLCVYSKDDASAVEIDTIYRTGEVTAACFSADDAFLGVLTANGRLDLYDTTSWELVFSQTIELYHYYNSFYDWTFNSMSIETSADNRLLIFADFSSAKYCAVLDPESWIVEAEASDVVSYDVNSNLFYFKGKKGSVRTAPLYSVSELKAWAKE